MQLNVELRECSGIYFKQCKKEVIMLELSEPGAAIIEPSAADAAAQLTKANKNALDFMYGAQKVMLRGNGVRRQ